MAYIPSWADNPNFQQGLQSFLQSVGKGFAPDFYARQTFQNMAQQDPNLIETISNMDDGQRETFNKNVLGSKNKNPLEKIGIGQKRMAREEQAAALAALTPAQIAERKAALAGTRTQTAIDRENTDNARKDALWPMQLEGAQIDLKGKKQKVDADTIALDEATRQSNEWKNTLARMPNVDSKEIVKLADAMVYKKPFDETVAARVTQDKVYGPILEAYVKSARDRLEIQSRKDITMLRTPQEKAYGLQVYKDQADNAANQLKLAQDNLSKLSLTEAYQHPEAYTEAQGRVKTAEENYNKLNEQYVDYSRKVYDIDIKSPEDFKALNLAQMIIDGTDPNARLENIKDPTMLAKVKAILGRATGNTTTPKPAVGKTGNTFGTGKNPFQR